jgi:hypothetical protein
MRHEKTVYSIRIVNLLTVEFEILLGIIWFGAQGHGRIEVMLYCRENKIRAIGRIAALDHKVEFSDVCKVTQTLMYKF